MNENIESTSIYFTKDEIVQFIKPKLSKEHQNKTITLSNVEWDRNGDGSITLDFLL